MLALKALYANKLISIKTMSIVMEYNELCRELKRLIKDNAKDPDADLLSWVSEASRQLADLQEKLGHTNKETSSSDEDEDENTGSAERLLELQHEKKKLLNELSELAGTKFLHNNPGLANVGDDKTPSKIGERFSELYDNYWTDAMETLDGHKFEEKESITMLLEVLQVINSECISSKETRLNRFMSLALLIDHSNQSSSDRDSTADADLYQNVRMEKGSVNQNVPKCDQKKETLTHDQLKTISVSCCRYLSVKDHNLIHDKKMKEAIQQKLDQQFPNEKGQSMLKHKSVKHYIEKCSEVCWAMCLQIPPFVMVLNSNNTDLYRSYSKSGDTVDYFVWPALLLSEGGPVLYKGIAQMTKDDAPSQDPSLYENVKM